MAEPAKKFSFGFTKTTKRPNLSIKPRNEPKQEKQLIDCLEGKLIKVKGYVVVTTPRTSAVDCQRFKSVSLLLIHRSFSASFVSEIRALL